MKFAQNNHPTLLFGPACLFGTWEYNGARTVDRYLSRPKFSATLILNLNSSEFDVFEIEDNKMDIEYFVLEAITVTSPGKSIISVLNSSVPKNQLILKIVIFILLW